MAISEGALQGILSGLKLAQERRVSQMHGRIASQKMEEEKAQEELRREARLAEHQDTVKFQDAQLAELKATHKRQAMEFAQKIAAGYQKGEPAVGAEVIPGTPDAGGNQQDTLRFPIQNDQGQVPGIIGNVPLPNTDVQVDAPATFARKFAERKEAMLAPDIARDEAKIKAAEEKRLAEIEATAKNQQVRDKNLEDYKLNNKLKEIEATGAQKVLQERVRQSGANSRAALKIKSGVDFDPTQDISDAINGNITLTEMRRKYPDRNKFEAVAAGVTESGAKFLDDKQKPLLDAFTPAFSALHLYDQWLDLRKGNAVKSNIGVGGIGTKSHEELYNLEKAISENLGTFQSLMIKTGRGVTDKRIAQVQQSYTPRTGQDFDVSVNKVKRYRELLDELFTSTYSNLSMPQQKAIRGRLASVVPGIPSAPDLIPVIHKGTGKKGKVASQDFDPNLYDKQ